MSQAGRGFEFIEHTADVGIRVWADTAPELFTSAAEGMFSLICSPEQVRPAETRIVEVSAGDWGGLVFSWLDELLYLQEVEEFLVSGVNQIVVEPFALRAEVSGERYDPDRHLLLESIKAVTFHGLDVDTGPPWKVQVIFDV